MRKICNRGLNWIQIIDYQGTVRICGWISDNIIGSLSCQSMKEIYHSKEADALRERLINQDYSLCNIDACPYLAMNVIDNHLIQAEEIPEYPEELYLAYENICNYHCMSCDVHDMMARNRGKDLESGYDKIETELKKVLPYVKKISANGCGELFVSKRILKILSEWQPQAPAEEVSVLLETNGALFDEEHWKQIENLGKYHLTVAVTVMSFDESAYQLLSGTKLPISQIENNLLFIKKLREQGIVNHFQIATVVQERNFRTMPEFARRSIKEFGADSVRLRPYAPWGSQEPEIEWFMDVRNPRHPYYGEYQEMKKAEIFKHPKVQDWSGGLDTVHVKTFPYKRSFYKEKIITKIISNTDTLIERLRAHMDEKRIVVYGMGIVGKILVTELIRKGIKPVYLLDKYKTMEEYQGTGVYNLEETKALAKDVGVIITPLLETDDINKELSCVGYKNNRIHITQLTDEKQLL